MLVAALTLTACDNMSDQPKLQSQEGSAFFADGQAARPLVAGTVARGHLEEDTVYHTGRVGDQFVAQAPVQVTAALLDRGQDRFVIHCTPCHGQVGAGDGMIVQRGFPQPPTYHQDRLRQAPDGHLFDVITHGYGRMYALGNRIEPADRWAIVTYIRALQASQNVPASQLSDDERAKLDAPRTQSGQEAQAHPATEHK
ncbi:MAG: cytochrome c [Phycisphaeraceae bacterium]